ncbi:hypothetical protein BDR26DRAFT_320 [Obelidium mucronatum]|nr:hypothetical protein BDR26DRAFT_320 [Obelidium mucronatum]
MTTAFNATLLIKSILTVIDSLNESDTALLNCIFSKAVAAYTCTQAQKLATLDVKFPSTAEKHLSFSSESRQDTLVEFDSVESGSENIVVHETVECSNNQMIMPVFNALPLWPMCYTQVPHKTAMELASDGKNDVFRVNAYHVETNFMLQSANLGSSASIVLGASFSPTPEMNISQLVKVEGVENIAHAEESKYKFAVVSNTPPLWPKVSNGQNDIPK